MGLLLTENDPDSDHLHFEADICNPKFSTPVTLFFCSPPLLSSLSLKLDSADVNRPTVYSFRPTSSFVKIPDLCLVVPYSTLEAAIFLRIPVC
jgi:hypothetical protein